jgi:DNA-binding MarR family transcriptional regulator
MDQGTDSISIIEMELMTLVRQLDTLGRWGSLYVQVDRAGYLALRTLERLGPVRTNALAEALHLDASTVTRQVTALVAGGFVARRPDPADGRSSTLALTTEGRRIMRAVERERRHMLLEMFDDWAEDDRRDLGRVLTKLNVSLIDLVAQLRDQPG